MPHFCNCGCGGDTCVCQQCGRIVCGMKTDSMIVPRSGRKGNVCKTCQKKMPSNQAIDVRLQVQNLFSNQSQIWPDSADVGIRINGDDERPEFRKQVKALITGPGWKKIKSWRAPYGPRNEAMTWQHESGVEIDWVFCKKVEFLSANLGG